MNEANSNTSKDKYIPPHRRGQVQSTNSSSNNAKTKSNPPTKHVKEHTLQNLSARLTPHAFLRKEQRNISHQSINAALTHGEKLASPQATVHVDETTQVVMAKNGMVITVQENKRNTRYDILGISRAKERKLLKQINEKNNDFAMCELAQLYLDGDLGMRNVQQAYQLLLRAAEKNNSHAMCLISNLHKDGDLGKVDLAESQKWLEKAADAKNKYAMAVVGQRSLMEYLALRDVEGKEEERKILLEKTMRYLNGAAAKGSTRAMWQKARIWEEGLTGEQDLEKAIQIYCDAAKLGSPTSLHDLQRLVQDGKVKPEVFEDILDQTSTLIAKTSSELAVEIGFEQIHGTLGINPQRGFRMLEQAAKKNNEHAITILAKCHQDGIDCEPDPIQSQYWFNQLKVLYEKAGYQGNVNALFKLGNLYLKGVFGEIDFDSAEQQFTRAANSGDVDSLFYLGSLYLRGCLGNREPEQGIPWIEKAVEIWSKQAYEGNIDAIDDLIELYLNKELGFKNYQKVAQWLSFSASKGNDDALEMLIFFHLKGKVKAVKVENDQIFSPEILTLLKQKADNDGHPRASQVLAVLHQIGFLPQEENGEDENPWAKKLEESLIKKSNKSPSAAFLLGKLYLQQNGVLLRNLQQAIRLINIASCLPCPQRLSISINKELKEILNGHQFDEYERKEIFTGILAHAMQAEKKSPYKIGRVLGDVYSEGKITEIDFIEARKWYEMSANLNNSKAMCRLGLLHLSGKLGTVDEKNAFEWFGKALAAGNQKAAKHFVKLLESQTLAPEVKAEIKLRIERSQEEKLDEASNIPPVKIEIKPQKDSNYMYEQGKKYKEGSEGYPKDYPRAAFWFRKSSDKKHIDATYELAEMYESGMLGGKVRPVALGLFKSVAKKGHPGAVEKVIKGYSEGILTQADLEKVAKWQTKKEQLIRKFTMK